MQQLKSMPTDFATLILNAPDSSLTEFLTIIENTERSEATIRILNILQNEIEYCKSKINK